MKKWLIASALLCATSLAYAGDIPEKFQGEWSTGDSDACSSIASDGALFVVKAQTIEDGYGTFTLTGHDKTSFSGVFSGKFNYEGEEDSSKDNDVTLSITDKGKLLMNGETLYTKCSADEVAARQESQKSEDLKSNIIGVWSDVSDGSLFTFFNEDTDKVSVLMNNNGPYHFDIDSVDTKTNSVTIAQNASSSNAVWTMQMSNNDGIKSAVLITSSNTLRHKLSYVRDITGADQRLLDDAQNKVNHPTPPPAPPKHGKTAWLISPPTNIRTEPGGTVICVMRDRQEISVSGAKAADDGTVWYKTDACGDTGYVSSTQLKF